MSLDDSLRLVHRASTELRNSASRFDLACNWRDRDGFRDSDVLGLEGLSGLGRSRGRRTDIRKGRRRASEGGLVSAELGHARGRASVPSVDS